VHRFTDVVKALKRRHRSLMACPRCGSPNIAISTGMDGWMVPPLYLCRDCGYAGRLVLEFDPDSHSQEQPRPRDDDVSSAEH
jgi:predicted RNA-binding Zn-ribbon protein involved in translation (DUF1610 family)